jgi:hypothetical protein
LLGRLHTHGRWRGIALAAGQAIGVLTQRVDRPVGTTAQHGAGPLLGELGQVGGLLIGTGLLLGGLRPGALATLGAEVLLKAGLLSGLLLGLGLLIVPLGVLPGLSLSGVRVWV